MLDTDPVVLRNSRVTPRLGLARLRPPPPRAVPEKASAAMLAALGFATIAVLLLVTMSRRASVLVALILLPLSLADKNISLIGDGIDPCLQTAHILGWLGAAGLVVLLLAAIRFWRAPGLGWWARVHPTLILAASAIFLSFAWWTHLLNASLKF